MESMERLSADSQGAEPVSASAPPGPSLAGCAVGVLHPRFEDVHRVAVLRGGGLGDLLFALPAVDALAAAYPEAHVTLLGTPLHAELLRGRTQSVDEVVVLPFAPGVRERPEPDDGDEVATQREVTLFQDRVRARGVDLGIQLHGGGRFSNPFLLGLGPRHSVGAATPDAQPLERTLSYQYFQHEVARALEVAALAGAPAVTLEPRLRATEDDLRGARALLPERTGPLLVVHPSATDPRRRWPAERFAAVATAAVDSQDAAVLVVGDEHEHGLTAAVTEMARAGLPHDLHERVVDLGGRLDVGGLVGVLALADVLLGNDSGPRHLAQALGCATVAVYWAGNVINAGPMSRDRHRVHVSWTSECPECGADVTQVGWTAPRCPHDPSFLRDVGTAAVRSDVLELLASVGR